MFEDRTASAGESAGGARASTVGRRRPTPRPAEPWRRRAIACAAIALLAAGAADAARGQGFPSRNIVIVVPYPPGGGTDVFARAIGQELARELGVSVTVENRSGASGLIGAEAVARAPADGHTLLYAASTIALSRLTAPKRAFDPQRDLRAVTMTASIPQILVVHPDVKATSVAALVALSKAHTGELRYGSGGHGSAGHFTTELFKQHSGLDARHIPYRGAAPAMNALLSGEVHLGFLVPPLVQPYLPAGKMRALAVTARKRAAVLPGLPTLQELGLAGFEAMQWHGFFAPLMTAPAVVSRLHEAVGRALAAPSVTRLFANQGAEVVGNSPDEFAAAFDAEVQRWRKVASDGGLKFD